MEKRHIISKETKLKYWGEGPWIEEPDEIHFEHDKLKCKVTRGYVPEPYVDHIFGGHLCGYVCIPKDHPWYEKNHHDFDVDVHGGLTYFEFFDNDYWIGFDCAHSGDIIPSIEFIYKNDEEMKKLKKDSDRLYEKFNIDRSLFSSSYKDIDFVINECKSLAEKVNKAKLKEINEKDTSHSTTSL